MPCGSLTKFKQTYYKAIMTMQFCLHANKSDFAVNGNYIKLNSYE